jgi:hypothetical protein
MLKSIFIPLLKSRFAGKKIIFFFYLPFTLYLSACSHSGYSPAFEADRFFKSDTEKYIYLSKKYESVIHPLYYIINPACYPEQYH